MSRDPVAARVREATAADLDAIVAIYLDSARHHAALAPVEYCVPDEDAVRTRFGGMLQHADDEDAHFVAEVDGRVIGALDVFRRPDGSPGSMRLPKRTAEFGIGVLEEWRGRGVGTALMATAEVWARTQGLDALVLEVATRNEAAHALYERLGYHPVSQRLERPIGRS